MSERTIANAREQLEAGAPMLNPEMYERFHKELKEAEGEATGASEKTAHDRYLEQHAAGQEVQQEACAVRDEATALLASVRSGQMTAREASAALDALRHRHRSVAGRAQRIATAAEAIERIEADPIGHYDRIIPADRRRTFTF
jgi:hypothetical protein